MMKKPLSIYLHFPFCARKCRYCDFLSWPADEETRAAYVHRMKEEIVFRAGQLAGEPYEVGTVFFGGGTPSLMSGDQLKLLMTAITEAFEMTPDPEVSIECNPGTVDAEKLKAYAAAGINRISFGLQSMDDHELACLGRIHRAADFIRSFDAARAAGFENINVDLMSALPGQTTKSWEQTLIQTAKLTPEHISAYSLIIEPDTPFDAIYGEDVPSGSRPEGFPPLPDEETEREMYRLTGQILKGLGYQRYEISNYAKPGYECRHNMTYWTMGDYLGLGLGASGKIGAQRLMNTDKLREYMTSFETEVTETLTRQAQMEETMFLGLRLMRGVSLSAFQKRFGAGMTEIYGEMMKKWIALGCLELTGGNDSHLRLTEKGIDVSNQVMADCLLSNDVE